MSDKSAIRSVAVVVNPGAGRHKGDDAAALEEVVGGRGAVDCVSSLRELDTAIDRATTASVEAVAVCGGDGTLGRVVTTISRRWRGESLPRIVPLGGGTMNTIARSLTVPRRTPAEILRRCLRAPVKTIRQKTMTVGDSRLGFMIGAGVPARFLSYYEEGGQAGTLRAIRALSELVASAIIGGQATRRMFAPVAAKVAIDGCSRSFEHLRVVYASVIEDIGLGFRPTPRVSEDAERFEILLSEASAIGLVAALPSIRMGRPLSHVGWCDELCVEADIAFLEPTVYMVDGDVEGEVVELNLRSGPVIEVIVPGTA